jgi:ribosomal protein S6--L-glutamate ligase
LGLRIIFLANGPGWHIRDLLRAAEAAGLRAEVRDFRGLWSRVGQRPLPEADAVVVRTMPPGSLEQVVFRMDLLHRLLAGGVPVVNPPAALEACIDKYLSSARLAAAGLPVPPTIVCQRCDDALQAFQELGGDVVVKPLFGSEGRGMVRVSDAETAWRVLRTWERIQAVLYLQRFIPHEGYDLRAFVLGGRVLAAMRRWSRDGWRTNVAQGGQAEAVRLSSEEERLAVRAAEAVQAAVCGVDLLPGRDGRLYVLEVNAVPGWRALSRVCRRDVAAEVLSYVASLR